MAGPFATVFDDGARDVLAGGPDVDWFIANRTGGVTHVLVDPLPTEIKDEIG
jgi:hypothetical protein